MANVTIGDIRSIAPAQTIQGDELIEIEQDGQTRGATISQLTASITSSQSHFLTTSQYGISPTSNSSTNINNLQNFVDYITDNDLFGIIDPGVWMINRELQVYSNTRLSGRGMFKTILRADIANWNQSNWTMLDHDPDRNNFTIGTGLYLSDMQIEGGDKNRTDNGGLVVIMGMEDFVVERMFFIDGSSYNIFIAGYGLGSFTNDINSEFWNSLHRGTVRDCLSWRGQIGFGTEGGAENVLFERCTAIGNAERADMDWGLHAFRSASGYNITLHKFTGIGYRNGVLLDRYKHIHINGSKFDRVRNGVAVGSFYASDGEISKDVRITNNWFQVEPENGEDGRAINDSYISGRQMEGLIITGNNVKGGRFSIGQARRCIVQGNVAHDSASYINFFGSSSGLASNNLMEFQDSSSNVVVDGGNNIPYANTTGY